MSSRSAGRRAAMSFAQPASAHAPSASSSSSTAAQRPRSPAHHVSDDGSTADSRRVRARFDGQQETPALSQQLAASDTHSTAPEQASARDAQPSALKHADVLQALPSFSRQQLLDIHAATQQLLTRPLRPVLAKIEWQLVMQCCDHVSLLSLARCSRSTLAAASSEFAWRNTLVPLWSSTPSLEYKLTHSLLRFAGICLWRTDGVPKNPFARPPLTGSMRDMSTADLAAFTSVARLRGIDCSHRYMAPKEQEHLLTHPATAQLTELYMKSELSADLLHALPQRHPLLRTLGVHASGNLPRDAFVSLTQLQHLTELHLTTFTNAKQLSTLTTCRSLRTLSLSGIPDRWSTLLSAPALQTLRALEMHFQETYHPDHATWFKSSGALAAALANQSALDSLLISGCHRIDELLPLVTQHCADLRTLRLRMTRLDAQNIPRVYLLNLPSAALIQSAVTSRPQLHLMLELPPRPDGFDRDDIQFQFGQKARTIGHWDECHAMFTRLTQMHPGRVELRIID